MTYPNRDGSNRQTIIAKCLVGEPIVLEAEPDNPQHENAIRVLRKDGSQIGYVAPRMATKLVGILAGVTVFVAGVDHGGPYLEVSLLLVLNQGGGTAAVESYARRLLHGSSHSVKRRARRRALVLAAIAFVALVGWLCLSASRQPARGLRAASGAQAPLAVAQR